MQYPQRQSRCLPVEHRLRERMLSLFYFLFIFNFFEPRLNRVSVRKMTERLLGTLF